MPTAGYRGESGYAADDLYGTHNQVAIAERRKAEAEAERAAEARRAEWEARIAQGPAAGAEEDYYSGNSYQGVLADTYESAYARRLRGFDSPTYNMPSSYEYLRYSSKFRYLRPTIRPTTTSSSWTTRHGWSPNTSPPCSGRGARRR